MKLEPATFIPSSSSPSFGFPPTWSTDAPVNLCQAPDKPELDLKQSTLFCSIADSLQLPLEALQCTLVAQRWSCALGFVFFFVILLSRFCYFLGILPLQELPSKAPLSFHPTEVAVIATHFCRQFVAVDIITEPQNG